MHIECVCISIAYSTATPSLSACAEKVYSLSSAYIEKYMLLPPVWSGIHSNLIDSYYAVCVAMVMAGLYIAYTPHQYSTYYVSCPIRVYFQIYTCYVWKFICGIYTSWP